MSNFPFNARLRSGPLLASVAAVALIAGAAIADTSLSSTSPAQGAAIATGDLSAQGAPSFAPLIERVKPAVVSVKVMIEDADMESDDQQGSSDGIPPQMRKFFQQFGDQ